MLRISALHCPEDTWVVDRAALQHSRVLADCLTDCNTQSVRLPFAWDVVKTWLEGGQLEQDITFALEAVEV